MPVFPGYLRVLDTSKNCCGAYYSPPRHMLIASAAPVHLLGRLSVVDPPPQPAILPLSW